jgi:copper chaperone CopZ
MTTVEALYRYATSPGEATLAAIGGLREVYGIRSVRFDQTASTVRVEYDATRLNEATVHQLLRRTGLDIGSHETLAFPAPPPPQPAAT